MFEFFKRLFTFFSEKERCPVCDTELDLKDTRNTHKGKYDDKPTVVYIYYCRGCEREFTEKKRGSID